MSTPTTAVLQNQTDLKRSTAPSAGTDVTNKTYVDTTVAAAVAAATPNATSGIGGGTKGVATCDESKGLTIPSGANMQVKVDGTSITFDVNGKLQSSAPVPTATSAPGGGAQGKVTADENKALKILAGVLGVVVDGTKGVLTDPTAGLQVKVDGTTVGFDLSGQLKTLAAPTTPATSAPGGGTIGVATYDEDFGLTVAPGTVARVKVDGSTMGFDISGRLKALSTGGPTGLISNRASFARTIVGGPSAPNPITLGTNVSASSYPHGSTTGERFEFTVPDDYFQGSLDILLVYSMGAAIGGPNNVVRLATAAEIARTTGVIDSATYPLTQQNLTTPASTSITRVAVLSLAQGTFEAGDDITVLIERIGGSVNDLSTAAFQVIAYEWRYTGIVDTRIANQQVEFFGNAAGENPTVPVLLGTQTDAEGFPSATDAGTKFTAIVPDNWDGLSPAFLSITYAMSTNVGGNVKLNTYGEIADVVSGTIAAMPNVNFTTAVPASTGPSRLFAFAQVPANLLHKGDHLTFVLGRRTAGVPGNSTAQLNLIGVSIQFAIAPTAGFSQSQLSESYLSSPSFGNLSGTVVANDSYPAFGSTFDKLYAMSSTSASGRVDAAFSGRLASFQTQITNLKINIIGTGASPQYHLQVFAEGSGNVPVYDSGLQAAPAVLTELTVLAVQLSAQPTSTKRFHVVVQAFIDSGESVSVSLPFVAQG